ncbi:A disintegrin and metalloproteinase with thrombospondin motifs 5-like [Cotesia glomerata]|uniref:A disintegrin and metalloproteinase with thrombospondin motifs 5-like n=1 Tax=Cotesia glomerata TaxID=32391 RepID=UPI001D0314B4|nr:A disintegrin and metalloproteinase with thrombospondin motifs 5-like [Cotesia glomerata]
MTPEERLKIFRTAGTDVPPYEIAEIKSARIQKRDAQAGHRIKIRAFGEDIEHYLTPLDDVLVTNSTRIQEIRTIKNGNPGDYKVEDSNTTIDMIRDYIYEEKSRGITIAIKNNNGSREMSGIIGYKNLQVSPMPSHLRKSLDLNRSSRSVDDEIDSEYDEKLYHIIHKLPSIDDQNLTAPLFRVQRSYSNEQESEDSDHSIAYPEILVIVDHGLFKIMNFDMTDMVVYVIAFWNGVDMLYRDFDDPKIRLNIAAIAVAQDSKALDYIKPDNSGLNADRTLEEKGKWLFESSKNVNKFQTWSYDASLTMIGSYKLGRIINEKFSPKVGGIANLGEICRTIDNSSEVTKCGIFNDVGNYQAIRAAAHELGHILGSKHDGDPEVARECSSELGAIMASSNSDNDESPYSHSFSECSKAQIRRNLREESANCVWTKPKGSNTKPLPRILPGKLISAEAQCPAKRGYPIPVKDESMCRILICKNLTGNRIISIDKPAADGTSCAENKVCLHGHCVEEGEVLSYYACKVNNNTEECNRLKYW